MEKALTGDQDALSVSDHRHRLVLENIILDVFLPGILLRLTLFEQHFIT